MGLRRISRFQKSFAVLILSLLPLGVLAGWIQKKSAGPEPRTLARHLVKLGDYSAALDAYERAFTVLESQPDGETVRREKADLWLERGQCNLELGRASHALEDLHRARVTAPEEVEHWIREGEALLKLEHFDEASAVFEEAAPRFPDKTRFLRYAAGCACFVHSKEKCREGAEILDRHCLEGRNGDLAHAVRKYCAGSPRALPRTELLSRFISPPHDTAEKNRAFVALDQSRQLFERAEEMLEGFETTTLWEPKVALTRAEMHFRAENFDQLRLVAEVQLRQDPEGEFAVDLRQLLANAFDELELHDESIHQWNELRKLHSRRKDFVEALRAASFALETMLRKQDGRAALELLEELRLVPADNPLRHYYYGRSFFLSGQKEKALNHCDRAAEILRETSYRFNRWFRSDSHIAEIVTGLAHTLRALDRIQAARDVATALVGARPTDAQSFALRASVLRGTVDGERFVVRDQWDVLQRAPRRREDWSQFESDQRALIGKNVERKGLVQQKVNQVLARYATGVSERSGISPHLKQFLTKFKQEHRKDRNRYDDLESAGAELLSDLSKDPFLAVEVVEELRRLGNREQSYLLLCGLSADHPSVPHLRFFLAQQDLADGRIDTAVDRLNELLEESPTDREALILLWSTLAEHGRKDDEVKLIEEQLTKDPMGSGRLLALLSAIEHGGALSLAEIATAGSNPQMDWEQRGLAALLLAFQGDVETGSWLAGQVITADAANPYAHAAMLLAPSETAKGKSAQVARDYLESNRVVVESWSVPGMVLIARWFRNNGRLDLAEVLLSEVEHVDPQHLPAIALRADILIELGRPELAEPLLDRLEGLRSAEEQIARRVIAVVSSSQRLEDLVDPIRDLRLRAPRVSWFPVVEALVSAAGTLAVSALQIAQDSRHSLSEDEVRFLAVQALRRQRVSTANASYPETLMKKLVSLDQATGPRDRDFEQWCSIDLSEEDHRLCLKILQYLCVHRIGGFPRLEHLRIEAVVSAYPALGAFARRDASLLFEEGNRRRARKVLLAQLRLDPADSLTLGALVDRCPDLERGEAQDLLTIARTRPEHAEEANLLGAWLEDLSTSSLDSVAKAGFDAGLVSTLRSLRDEQPLTHALLLRDQAGPLANFVRSRRIQELAGRFESILAARCRNVPASGTFMEYLGSHLVRMQSAEVLIDPSLIRTLCRFLSDQPQVSSSLYETAAALSRQHGDVTVTLPLAAALRRAVESRERDEELDAPLVRAVVDLAASLASEEHAEEALALVQWARKRSPFQPDLLLAEAELRGLKGSPAEAMSLRVSAVACGKSDPDTLVWWCQQSAPRLASHQALELIAWALSLDSVGERPDLSSRLSLVDYRFSYVAGDFERARKSFVAASRFRPEGDSYEVRLALFDYAVGAKGVSQRTLQEAFVVTQDPWFQALSERLEEEKGTRRPGRP